MKSRVLPVAIALMAAALLVTGTVSAEKKKKKEAQATETVAGTDNTEVHWMSVTDVQAAMKKSPKPVWWDVYTSWCGWCKVMDKKTYTNPQVIQYINEHFYAVKLDAETKDSIAFGGQSYGFDPAERANHFAVQMLNGQLSYPTSVFMPSGFGQPMAIPGYQDVPTLEMILKYLGQEKYKVMPFPEWQKTFKASWVAAADGSPAVPPGH